ncbi:MAG: PD-(D/E)XK nuclease superfamily protein [candidate division WOR-3 bacterium]
MPDTRIGNQFRNDLKEYIISWNEDIEILEEKPVGWRFVGIPRKLDLILKHESRYLGIEAKYQGGGGTVDQKLIYTLEDAKSSPIPTLVVFAGKVTRDIKAKLVTSGIGLELEYDPSAPNGKRLTDPYEIFRQRVYIELGLDWFKLFKDKGTT